MSELTFLVIFFLLLVTLFSVEKYQEYKLKFYESKLVPHAFINSLTFLQKSLLQKNNENSNLYFDYQSVYFRNVLLVNHQKTHTIQDEISNTQFFVNYFNALKDVSYKLKVQFENNNNHNIYIPTFLFQPFIENIYKHGKETDSIILIKVVVNNSFFNSLIDIEIGLEDNETYEQKIPIKESSNGIYLSAIKLNNTCFKAAPGSFTENAITIKKSNNGNYKAFIYLPANLLKI
jgi:two-component system LytT family sensor kinase